MNPLVSILIPAHNAAPWIAESIRSAVAQSWPRKEIIIVDDGSKDNTLAVALQYASKELKVISQENQGAAAARNNAFSRAQGDYIQWLDADDLLAPDKIARQMEVIQAQGKPRTLYSSEWGTFTFRPSRARFKSTAMWRDLNPVEWLILKLGENLWMQTATWLVSRELTEAAGPWNTHLLSDDDGEYFTRIVTHSDGVGFVPGARVYYRRAAPSLSYIGMSQAKLEAQFLTLQLYISHARGVEDSPRVREACISMLNIWRMSFFPEQMELFKNLEQLAKELGGCLEAPSLPWKYAWIQKLLGWNAAKKAQLYYNKYKLCLRGFVINLLMARQGAC